MLAGMKALLVVTLLLSVVSLFVEQVDELSPAMRMAVSIVDYVVVLLILFEVIAGFRKAAYKRVYIKQNLPSLVFTGAFVILFAYNKLSVLAFEAGSIGQLPFVLVIVRNLFILLKVFNRLRRLSSFIEEITARPAQTILFSFLLVILVGTLLLMMPFTSAAGRGLSFIDALFTSTSAVCVTGLIVVDTAIAFSLYGKIVILVLIQIGGLGIMILSFFTIFVLRRSMSIEDKMLISYMLSERDMTKLARSLSNIIVITFAIEGIGAALLFLGFAPALRGDVDGALFTAVFHSISAFCNAGFSTFSNSLEGVRTNGFLVTVIALLIILGGISFSVIINVGECLANRYHRSVRKMQEKLVRMTMNTKVVLTGSALLILAGMMAVYGLEHAYTMADYGLGEQYLSAFFQSVTLRTAGFNTIPFSGLRPVTYVAMAIFMFIGGASGSTAGGLKVNTAAVMIAYISATLRDRKSVTLYHNSITINTVLRAFLILLFAVTVIATGSLLLALFENAPIEHIVFEAVSAFGTVGLSSGITAALSIPGKAVIIFLMFLGRVGPLTVLAAASLGTRKIRIEYPRGEIAIG
ncbi:MAG: TrkH family potassium uptake protein [Spirochaetales bacterium]|nr:TrkH family potassium uptake protein [Spirochaetales bacterium]